MQATPSALRAFRWMRAAAAVAWLALPAAPALRAQATPPAAPASALSVLQGFVIDSIHDTPLAKAVIVVEGTDRNGITTDEGRFRIDSIPPGQHRVMLLHALLDTIGISMRTPAYNFVAGQVHELDLAIPTGSHLAQVRGCTPAQLQRGPAVMLGFVRDPETSGPAGGAKVELVFETRDLAGRRSQTVRSDVTDSTGFYRICGLPTDMNGKVQVFRNGISSGEVPVEVTNNVALRAFSIVSHQAVAVVKNDSGKVTRVAKGSARVTGKVTDKNGRPLEGARVTLQGNNAGNTAITRANGEFVLDSLPAGTQALVVRKLGYAVTEQPVELASSAPARTEIKMGDFVPTLAKVTVEAQENKALADVGYLSRKQGGMGRFYDGNQINHESMSFADVMRVDPSLRITPTGDGRTYRISDARNAAGGCVNYWFDGTPWEEMSPGDMDGFVRPNEIVAIEVYSGASAPPQYTKPGQSSCTAIVVWTQAKIRPNNTNRTRRP